MRLLDRYILRNFMQAYLYCIAGFISIWLVYDISDNLSTFLDDRVSFRLVVQYYLTQVPQILVVLLPVSLLLGLLFCLSRMSRANEIVSILAAGVSVPRLLLPLIAVGFLTTFATAGLNYSLAPHADYARKNFFESSREQRTESSVNGQIFRNRTDGRTWFVQRFGPRENEFTTVQVLQQDAQDNIVTNYLATRAFYRPEAKAWEMQLVKIVRYDSAGNILADKVHGKFTITNWSETPYRLTSANVRAEFLSVPELREYLHFNSDFPAPLLAPFFTHFQHRLALPWVCLVIVLIAAPLGIGYSRRGLLSSVAASIILLFSFNFLTHFFLALGEGYRIPAWIAAWTPNALFAVLGLYLLYLRSTNREAPRLNPFATREAAQ